MVQNSITYINTTIVYYDDIKRLTKYLFLQQHVKHYINILQEREYRFQHKMTETSTQTSFMFLDYLKSHIFNYLINEKRR